MSHVAFFHGMGCTRGQAASLFSLAFSGHSAHSICSSRSWHCCSGACEAGAGWGRGLPTAPWSSSLAAEWSSAESLLQEHVCGWGGRQSWVKAVRTAVSIATAAAAEMSGRGYAVVCLLLLALVPRSPCRPPAFRAGRALQAFLPALAVASAAAVCQGLAARRLGPCP
jgi:hypothetical protein